MSLPDTSSGDGRSEYLRYLQENNLSEADVLLLLPSVDDETQKRVDEVLKRAGEAGHHQLVQRLAEAASKNTNDLLSLMNAALVKRFESGGVHLPMNVFAGVFPTGSFNAHVVKRPDVHLILVNTGAFELMGAMASIIASLDVGTARTQAQLAARIFGNYCERHELPQAADLKELTLQSDRMQLAIDLTTAVEEFVLAHEYGHLVRGDVGHVLGESAAGSTSSSAGNRQAEIEADLWAANAVMWAAESDEERLIRCSGPLIFLSLAEIVEAHFEHVSDRPPQGTHPPAGNRLVELRYALAKAGLNSYTRLGTTCYKFSSMIAEEMNLALRSREAELLVADHIGGLVDDGLQEAVPISAQTSRIFVNRTSAESTPKSPWWKFW